jgi:hypothetical protein
MRTLSLLARLAPPPAPSASLALAARVLLLTRAHRPRLHFPNGFDLHSVTFGVDRVKGSHAS